MKYAKDLSGERFGNLVVSHRYRDENDKRVGVLWNCICDCGQTSVVNGLNLKRGYSQSCGCQRKKHGLSGTSEQITWSMMKQRCLNPRTDAFNDYGGRGITICDRWLNSAADFMSDMGPKPSPKHTLERRDVNGNYEPSNCYWATWDQQSNNRRNNFNITYQGETKTLSQWADQYGMVISTLKRRLVDQNLPFEIAVSKPTNR